MSKKQAIVLFLIIIVAAFLRFSGLAERGLVFWDEAYYSCEAKTLSAVVDYHQHKPAESLKEYLIGQGCIFPTGTAKPGFMALFSLAMLFFGPVDYSGMALLAFFGLLTVILVFFLAQKMYGTTTGLTASFLLAVSGYHILYSRSIFSNALGLFFLLAGIYIYLYAKPGKGRMFLAGLVFGFAFSVHYGLLPNILLILLAEVIRVTWKNSQPGAWKGSLFLIAGMLVFPLLFESGYRLIQHIYSAGLSDVANLTYFQSLARQFRWSAEAVTGSAGRDYLFYLRALWFKDGPIMLWFLPLGFVYYLYRLRRSFQLSEVIIFSQLFLILAFWMLNPGVKASRGLVVITAFSSIILSRMFVAIAARLKKHGTIALLALAGVLLVSNLNLYGRILAVRSGYKQAAAVMRQSGAEEVISLNDWPFWQFYLGEKIYANSDRIKSIADLDERIKKKKAVLVIDLFEQELFRKRSYLPLYEHLVRLTSSLEPLFIVPNRLDLQLVVFEAEPFTPDFRQLLAQEPGLQDIKIFRLPDHG